MSSPIHEFDPGGDTELVLITTPLQFLWKDDVLWMGMEGKEKGRMKEPPLEFPEELSAELIAEEFPPAEELPPPPAEDGPTEQVLADEFSEDPSRDGYNDTRGCPVNVVTYDTGRGGVDKPRGDSKLEGNQILVRMRVSSRHLILTSPVFQTMLDGPFKEGTICESGRQIITRTWDVEAMTIILNIIHGHHREVPRSLSLETLAKLALVIDYYEFHEVVEVFVDVWLNKLTKDLPTAYGKESTLWLLVSWVFGRAEIFETMTRLAMKQSTNEIAMIDLPIPGDILGEFDITDPSFC